MPRSSRFLAVAALTGAFSLVASPALAIPSGEAVDMPPWSWYVAVESGSWGIDEGSYSDGLINATDAWEGSILNLLSPDYVLSASPSSTLEPAVSSMIERVDCLTTTQSVSGDDIVLACNEEFTTSWGLSVTTDVRVLAPGDLARITYVITNTTASPIALGYRYIWEYGNSLGHVRSSQPDVVQNTDLNEGYLANPDVWSYNFSVINAGVSWGVDGQPFTGSESFHDGDSSAWVTLLPAEGRTIEPGESVALAFFHKMQQPDLLTFAAEPASAMTTEPAAAPVPQPAASSLLETPAQFMAEFATFGGRLTRGLPTGVLVGNWQPAASPELAETGAGIDENLLMGGLAAALLGAGAALLIGRRRAALPAQR